MQNERRLQVERKRNKEIILGKKAGWLLQGYFPLRDERANMSRAEREGEGES